MVKTLLDSWAWLEYFRGEPRAQKILEQIQKSEEVLTTAINIHECGFKILSAEGSEKAEKHVSFMKEKAKIINIDVKIALLAIELRQKYKLHTSDSLCYAAALLNDALFLTGDADFKGLPKVLFIGN